MGVNPYAHLIVNDSRPAPRDGVRVTYLGTNGYQFEIKGHALLVDPYFSRVNLLNIALGSRIQPDNPRVAEGMRHLAPKADAVRLSGGDIPGNGQGAEMTKGTNGVWEVTLGPIQPGAYRYNFNVDGVSVIDPRSSAISESNNNVWSLVNVPGADFMDTKDVPHGAVAAVTYYSSSLKKFRRMHVYTPPGYELGKGKFPVFYLLHGAGDCDEAWTSVGRAGFILDNLLASGKAKPMVVVMPAGHTSAFRFGAGRGRVRAGFPERHHALCRKTLPRLRGSAASRDGRPIDGWRTDVEHRHPPSR